ncbi:MAG: glycosyltransferase, partial [Bacilli bacterium]|nr:glycosyltransferase [Bacilli bacterium]
RIENNIFGYIFDGILIENLNECQNIKFYSSQDSTEEIIKSYQDKRIKYFKNKNQGIGKTRNFGLTKATAKYILFLDSDDYLEKTACERLYQKIENDDLDVVICDFYKEWENGNIEEIHTPHFENASLKENPDILTEYLCPWAKIYKRSLLEENKIKFVENLKYEDAPFVIETLVKAKKIGKIDECLNYYVIHGNSETTVRDRRCFDILKIIDLMRKQTKNIPELQEKMNQLTVRMITNYTIQQRVQKDKQVGMEFIDQAFDYLKKEVPDYKKNKYYKGRGVMKRTIEKNKWFTKIYCKMYH